MTILVICDDVYEPLKTLPTSSEINRNDTYLCCFMKALHKNLIDIKSAVLDLRRKSCSGSILF